jgi:hypothetical protein
MKSLRYRFGSPADFVFFALSRRLHHRTETLPSGLRFGPTEAVIGGLFFTLWNCRDIVPDDILRYLENIGKRIDAVLAPMVMCSGALCRGIGFFVHRLTKI